MDETEESTPVVLDTEAEMKQLLGLFDVPAFVRRGQDVEYALRRLNLRLRQDRDAMLDMVRLRLKQWASVATGPDDVDGVWLGPVAPLYEAAGASPPLWSPYPAPARRRRTAAHDLAASVARFNRRWTHHLDRLSLDTVNRQIDHYNRYYVLEKECVLGSARLAAKNFEPKPFLTPERLLDEFPVLTLPELSD